MVSSPAVAASIMKAQQEREAARQRTSNVKKAKTKPVVPSYRDTDMGERILGKLDESDANE